MSEGERDYMLLEGASRMSYSLDLRERVVVATQQGMSISRAAKVFQISVATIERWRRRARETGDLTPHTSPGRPRAIPVDQEADLVAQLHAYPDATLAEHCQQWREAHGVVVTPATMCRSFQRLDWTRKKSD